uniref:Stereocilin LRR domain-containing protein n=1 Tax=Anabas testudineus TaxID=64144 RepID=A0A3Q1H4A1_ANATE
MGAELEEAPESDEEQLWEKVLHFFLQSEGSGRLPPRPSFKVQDWFLSLRGSPHLDWILGLLQSLITLSERQPHRPILTLLSQNWRTVSAVLEAALQALVSGTYGQASAGLQGFICALKGRSDCAFSVSWLQQLLHFLETRNWKPVVSLHPAGEGAEYNNLAHKNLLRYTVTSGLDCSFCQWPLLIHFDFLFIFSLLYVICVSAGNLRQLILWGIRNNVTWNTQALGISSKSLPSSLPFLSCPSTSDGDELRSQQTPHGSDNLTVAQMGLDLHATCSDAAWYLSAAEEDFLWVHVCSEFFAHEFNNTVCANSSFWLQRAHQVMGHFMINEHVVISWDLFHKCLCPGLDDNCLAQLGSRSLSAQDFRQCFMPNNSVLISALCAKDSPDSHRLTEGSWAAAYCSKILNVSHVDTTEDTCQYREWALHHFTNTTLLELCGQTHGLREYICLNVTLYHQLLRSMPQFSDVCADLQEELESRKCFLQRFFDMLPAPYELDTSQLCVDPAPLMVDVLHKLSVCEVEGGEREGFLVALGYVLRVLDFMVGLSVGLDEGETEVRQGLGQAILLSSLLDNTSWATLQPEASTSVLHTVGVFLRREQNTTLKEDLLSCFSPVLWDLIQRDDNSSALQVLLQVLACYLQMPRDSIRTLVMSAEKDAVKRFISHMHQSWDQLQVETSQLQAMETMTAAFIQKFPRVTPELFVDLSQFIPFMSVSDIMSFPASLIVNDSVLTAIRDHSSGMKSLQKKAFVKRLLQSSVVGDVPSWPPYFLSSILPLLPYLPVSHFQQLTLQQVSGFSRTKEEIDGTMLDVLGPLLPFLDRDSLALVDRRALALRLEEMRNFCLPKEALRDISTVLNKDTVEQVLVGQQRWEDSLVGGVCMTRCMDERRQRQKTHSLIRGIVKARTVPVPTCADIRGTFPSAWTSTQLGRMLQEDLKQCVEVFGQDASLTSEQRRALWVKLRQSFSPVRELRPDQVLALGSVVTEMGERELQDTNLTDLGVLVHLGTLRDWSPKKMRAVISGVMSKWKLKVEQFTVVELATFGHLICGLYPSEIKKLSPYNLSMAVLYLREMSLPCTEQQMEALTSRLSRPEAFGPVSAWGPEVFTEIGTLAAGLEDMVLSALIQEQVEGITPEAIALMSPKKMAVVFSAVQLSWLSAEQAWAVTGEQWAELDTDQRHAVGLARYEGDVLQELRGLIVITFYFNKLFHYYFMHFRTYILYIVLFIMAVLWQAMIFMVYVLL